jgi:hypothetical protein
VSPAPSPALAAFRASVKLGDCVWVASEGVAATVQPNESSTPYGTLLSLSLSLLFSLALSLSLSLSALALTSAFTNK